MSAYMVDRDHIAYLLDAAMDHKIAHCTFHWYHNGVSRSLAGGDFELAAQVGQMLWNENRLSIEYRYPDTAQDFSRAPGPIDESYVYDEHSTQYLTFDPVQVIKACNCFAYQACEHPDWKESEAKVFIDTLIHYAISELPGYETAVWGAPERTTDIYRVF